MAEQKNQQSRLEKLKRKYRLVLMRADSYEEKLSFKITRMGVLLVTIFLFLLFLVLTIYLVAFTSLREFIPGYTDTSLPSKIYALQQKTDSLENVFRQKDLFILNLRRIINGDSLIEEDMMELPPSANYDTIKLSISPEDSALRAEYESQTKFSLNQGRTLNYVPQDLGNINFFPPLSGIITRKFEPIMDHFGVDIVATKSEAIKATLEGTVIFSDWTLETGYIIGLQHKHNLISIYKHNSSILKEQGTYVQAGETISIVGESGELSTGPHLHFEIWHNGKPIDPEEFILF